MAECLADIRRTELNMDYITGCARSGTTLLFQLMSSSRELWSLYREEHGIYEWDIGLHPDYDDDRGNQLAAGDATVERQRAIRNHLQTHLANSEWLGVGGMNLDGRLRRLAFGMGCRASRGLRFLAGNPRHAIDKNPKHVYRTEFLRTVFPKARFVFIVRDAPSNIASLLEGWEKHRFDTYRIPLNSGAFFQWSFELPPKWHGLLGRPLHEIAAFQWVSANMQILQACERWPQDCLVIRYEDLVHSPECQLAMACKFIGVEMTPLLRHLAHALPVVNSLSAPDAKKWQLRQREIDAARHIFAPTQARLGYPA